MIVLSQNVYTINNILVKVKQNIDSKYFSWIHIVELLDNF